MFAGWANDNNIIMSWYLYLCFSVISAEWICIEECSLLPSNKITLECLKSFDYMEYNNCLCVQPTSSQLRLRPSSIAGLPEVYWLHCPIVSVSVFPCFWLRCEWRSMEKKSEREQIRFHFLKVSKPLLPTLLTWGVVARLRTLESWHGHFISLWCWAST